jgi:hypothetical protein
VTNRERAERAYAALAEDDLQGFLDQIGRGVFRTEDEALRALADGE